MTRHSLKNGVYKDEQAGFWARPWIGGRRTWRKLKATKEREAVKEAARADWLPKHGTFRDLAESYLKADCPNRRLESRPERFVAVEQKRLEYLLQYFGNTPPEEIKMPQCVAYKLWRTRKIVKSTGERTIDLDLVTLSNVLSYGVAMGVAEFNYIRHGRPRFRRKGDVKPSRLRAPADADEIHRILRVLFNGRPQSEVNGWQGCFAYMTGCRTSELLRLRLDAKDQNEPGYIEGNHLFLGRRSKHGVNPFVLITPEMADMLKYFLAWHHLRYPGNPWFFPGREREARGRVEVGTLWQALKRACLALGLPPRTPHGLRSYYVTKRRSDGALDAQVAAEIGDKTVSLIRDTYGDLPANWTGGKKLSWLPEGVPAWTQKWTKRKSKSSGKHS